MHENTGRKNYMPPRHGDKCVDCGKPATVSDHRDYNRMKDVDKVCNGCNITRGPGIPKRPYWAQNTHCILKWVPHIALQIWFQFQGGKSVKQLAEWHGLTQKRTREYIAIGRRRDARLFERAEAKRSQLRVSV